MGYFDQRYLWMLPRSLLKGHRRIRHNRNGATLNGGSNIAVAVRCAALHGEKQRSRLNPARVVLDGGNVHTRTAAPHQADSAQNIINVHRDFFDCKAQRVKRTTISVPAGTIVPAAGACSRAMPVPSTCTPSPADPARSTASRTDCPTREGTATFFAAFTMTEPFTTGAGGAVGIDGGDSASGAGFGAIVSAIATVDDTG